MLYKAIYRQPPSATTTVIIMRFEIEPVARMRGMLGDLARSEQEGIVRFPERVELFELAAFLEELGLFIE